MSAGHVVEVPTSGVKEVQLVPQSESHLQMIERMASSPTTDVDKLERLIALYERATSRREEIAFNVAMSEAQTEMRPVAADATNPQTKSAYASYAALDRALRPIYTKHGFALSFDTGDCPQADCLRALCYVTHVLGHSRTYKIDMPSDGKGAKGGDVMTKTHATGSAASYGMRYLEKMIFNVAVGEDDDDGNKASAATNQGTAPEGFNAWLLSMQKSANDGTAALTAAWECSDNIFKNFILVKDWEAMKHTAKAVKRA